jgi:single-stranded-DNA-specific exonuclease
MEKRWKISEASTENSSRLQQELNIHPLLCAMLSRRRIDSFEKARDYFRPQLGHLHDPWLMKDMYKAVNRVIAAINQKERILVFGDYDVDGTTSVACMYRFLTRVCEKDRTDFYIPHRYREGYGVSKAGIDFAHENGFSLIIALDCGIKSVDLIRYASGLGIDFVICDHHTPDIGLPDAVAILNPKQPGCNYPYKELCGCGVGFKLISALAHTLQLPESHVHEYLDLVATAIAADIVPLTGENRVMVFFGLKKANENPNFGIMALKEHSGFEKDLQITNLLFLIAPRVNAAGRMDEAKKAVQLFVSRDLREAKSYAELLHSDNTDRKEADKRITEQALAMILEDTSMVAMKSTVVYQSHWHKGVVGIVASRLIDHYYRPTIVLTQSGEYAAGSARSVSGFNVYGALQQCEDLLIGYGGHFYAAGMTLELDKIEAFKTRFEEVVAATIGPDSLIPEIVIDAEIRFAELTRKFYSIICQMEPFGPDNLRPVFIARNVMDAGFSKIVKDTHIRFCLKQDGIIFNGIGFGMADKFHLLENKCPLDIVFTLDENEWNNEKRLQLKVIDFRLSSYANA